MHLDPEGYRAGRPEVIRANLRGMDVVHGHTLHNYLLDNQLALLEFARLPFRRYFFTGVFFKGVDMARFDFIGACENLDADMATLGRLLRKPFEVERHNVTEFKGHQDHRRAIRGDEALVASLRDLLADDIRFYEAALARR